MGFGNKKFLFQFLVDILPLGSGDPHIFEDPDPGSQFLADPKHCNLVFHFEIAMIAIF